MSLNFVSRGGGGGYGDRIVGLASIINLANKYNLKDVNIYWDDDYVCNYFSIKNCNDLKDQNILNFIDQMHIANNIIHDLQNGTKNDNYISANMPIDYLDYLNIIEYSKNSLNAYKKIYKLMNIPDIHNYKKYKLGIQIRTGDVHYNRGNNVIYLPKDLFNKFIILLVKYLNTRNDLSVDDEIFITCDNVELMYLITNYDKKRKYIFNNNQCHFDSAYNGTDKLTIIKEHVQLGFCEEIITSKVSNFGITSAYSSINNYTKKITLYDYGLKQNNLNPNINFNEISFKTFIIGDISDNKVGYALKEINNDILYNNEIVIS